MWFQAFKNMTLPENLINIFYDDATYIYKSGKYLQVSYVKTNINTNTKK